LGDVYGTTDPLEGTRAVHLAIENGINFFDSSPYYGLTLAEEHTFSQSHRKAPSKPNRKAPKKLRPPLP
jgi:aryl-alcohol dehydrogenase-like predicted oxidoreductase